MAFGQSLIQLLLEMSLRNFHFWYANVRPHYCNIVKNGIQVFSISLQYFHNVNWFLVSASPFFTFNMSLLLYLCKNRCKFIIFSLYEVTQQKQAASRKTLHLGKPLILGWGNKIRSWLEGFEILDCLHIAMTAPIPFVNILNPINKIKNILQDFIK